MKAGKKPKYRDNVVAQRATDTERQLGEAVCAARKDLPNLLRDLVALISNTIDTAASLWLRANIQFLDERVVGGWHGVQKVVERLSGGEFDGL